MKKTIVSIMALAALTAAAQKAPADSVTVITNVRNVIVADNTEGVAVSVADENGETLTYLVSDQAFKGDWDVDIPFKTKRRQGAGLVALNDFYVGMTFSDKSYMKDVGVEFGVNNAIGYRFSPNQWSTLTFGLGINWTEHKTARGVHFEKIEGLLCIFPDDPEASNVSSKIWISRILVPVTWQIRLTDSFGVRVGAVAAFNYYTKASTTCKIGDYKYSETYSDLPVNVFTAEFFGGVTFKNYVGVYAKWAPLHTFRKGMGPEMPKLSLGLNLLF